MKLTLWRLMPLVLFTLLIGFFWRGLSLDPQTLPSAQLGKPLPKFQLPALGEPEGLFKSSSLHGHIALLNVWASWCAACTEEQVLLLQLAQKGVMIYGLNYKDATNDATAWLTEWGNPYQMVGQDFKGTVGIDLGVYGAPETFLIDKTGVIRYRHAGVLTTYVWKHDFLPRIRVLEKTT